MKFSKYNLPVEVDKGIVLYNSKLAKYVNIFKNEDISKFRSLCNLDTLPEDNEMVQLLYKHGYVVDESLDEYKEVQQMIEQIRIKDSKKFAALLYVTEKCNFRCVYCPQKHLPKTLSEENWAALYKHLKKNILNGNYNFVEISFFGGEPLLELNNIIDFTTKLKELNKEYDFFLANVMTTNAYLLTPDVYNKLRDLNFRYFQITLDGFAETHDKARPRYDGQKTWDKIVENLKYINEQDDNITISLRTNCNDFNKDSLKEFYNWLNDTLDNPKITFDLQAVRKFSDTVKDEFLCTDDVNDLYKFTKKASRFEEVPKRMLTFLGMACYSSMKNSYTISADGLLSKCEQTYDDNENYYVGHFDDNGDIIHNENYKQWSEDFELKECSDCLMYPLCGARQCVRRKVLQPQKRPDCTAKRENVEQKIIKLIREGYLHKDHESKIPIK